MGRGCAVRTQQTARVAAIDSEAPVVGACLEYGGSAVADESDRARLINEISRVIREPMMPEATRTAGLTLIGWLARRMPGELPHALGVAEARESERRLQAARRKVR
jgi:hypothetical protein